MGDGRSSAGADADGFVSRATLRDKAGGGKDAFVTTYPNPGILVVALDPSFADSSGSDKSAPRKDPEADTEPAGARHPEGYALLTQEGSDQARHAAAKYKDRVAFLVKRAGNPFPHMISIGRAASNDVVLGIETVSKLHGYFLREGEEWYFTDYKSTNGTIVNGKRLGRGEKALLTSGTKMKIGLDIAAFFLSPEALFQRAKGD